jgi:hypothetical protein
MKMYNSYAENENVKQYAEIQAHKQRTLIKAQKEECIVEMSIGIEIPTGKLQRIQERILLIEIVLRSSHAEDITLEVQRNPL